MGFICKLILLLLLGSTICFGEIVHKPVTLPVFPHLPQLPVLPPLPDDMPSYVPVEDLKPTLENEGDKNRVIEKIDTLMLKVSTNVYVPLEIISDVEIEATLVDDQEVIIPFNIETNKEQDKKDYYKLKFSENEIDIDKDGVIDTYLYTTKYINSKIFDGNYVNIKGSGISREGTFYKKVYLTIEVE